jgi:hypothetical protein
MHVDRVQHHCVTLALHLESAIYHCASGFLNLHHLFLCAPDVIQSIAAHGLDSEVLTINATAWIIIYFNPMHRSLTMAAVPGQLAK